MITTEHQKTRSINIYHPETPTILSMSEQECLRELLSNDFVLDDDQDVPDCKKLGQKFFDQFKMEWCHCSSEAAASLQKVCEAIPFHCFKLGKERREYVSKAWNGVGDLNWQWKRPEH